MLNAGKSEDQNFWISYADLMAGLLFVFILVVGAIVVKTVLMQSSLQTIKEELKKEKEALKVSETALFEKKQEVKLLESKLLASNEENIHLGMKISLLENEVNKLEDNVSILESEIKQKSLSLALTQKEIQTLKELLLDKENETMQLKSSINSLNNELNSAKTRHESDMNLIQLKDDEIAQLQKALLIRKKAYEKVIEDLNLTKTKIKNLTGIKIKVIQKLKQKLGDSINIDPKSGSLRFSSNILFNQGQSQLKPEAKKELNKILGKYINTLLDDPKIRKYIDTITIEGHTNSDGSYIYNLNLSQQRALSVMKFLYEQYPKNKKLFRKYLNASGRSYTQPILTKENKEDKDASRRIEIKFHIKNEEAVKELMNYLNKGK